MPSVLSADRYRLGLFVEFSIESIMAKQMTIGALAGWYGGARTIAPHVGAALAGCSWVGVPFAGGMSELAEIKATSLLVSDKHRHIINLARIVADKSLREKLIHDLRIMPVHPDVLKECQDFCRKVIFNDANYEAAIAYFVCCWMAQGARAGTEKEFAAAYSFRYSASGGDSAKRFRSATESLNDWDEIMPRCTFIVLDAFEFIAECKKKGRDRKENGLYLDPPWPEDGADYLHKFTDAQQVALRDSLLEFEHMRIVVRFGDNPLIRKLYTEDKWTWNLIEGRTQANNDKAEVLLIRKRT